jgi:two-component system, cell cycle sensor histidine kinase and response regulator CckA
MEIPMTNQDNRPKDAMDLRQKAEALARERAVRTLEDGATLSPEEIRKTLHELRVHQIELEMQNEELRTAQAEIEAGRARYFDLYDLAPVGYCTLSEQGLILEANLTAAILLGTARGDLIKQPISRFILKEDQDIYYLHRKNFFETHSTVSTRSPQAGSGPAGEPRECELRMVKPDGVNFWAHLTAIAAQAEDGAPVCRCVISDITERKLAEDALQRVRFSIENLSEGVFWVGETGCFTDVNAAACRKLGYTREELLTMSVADIDPCFPPEQWAPHWEEMKQCGTKVLETVHRAKNGNLIPMELVVHSQFFGNQRYNCVLGRDITERKLAENTLRESIRFSNSIMHAARDIVVFKDDNFVFRLVNPAMCNLLGKAERDIIGKTDFDLFPYELALKYRNDDKSVIESGQSIHIEEEVSSSEGIRYVSTIKAPVLDGKNACQGIVVIVRDITERKRMEESLRESELKFRTLVEASSSGIWRTDATGRNTYVSPRWCEITGMSEADAAGQGWASGLHPDDRIPVRIGWENSATAAKPYTNEFRFVRPDGRLVWVLCQASPVMAGDHVAEWIGTITDITELKQAEAEREKLQAQLTQAQKMESVGRLAGGVAHDFNNMLGIILGYGGIVMEKLHPGDPLRDDVKKIVEAGKRSAALTRQLLAFSRKQPLQPEVVNLNDLLHHFEKMLQRLIGEDIDLQMALADDLAFVLIDPGQFDQTIMNLAVNARDAMPTGGKLTIETANVDMDELCAKIHTGVLPGKYVMISMTDSGCGMDETVLAQIFEPFFTTKERGKGTGLGLATVYGIVKQSGGNIWAYSEPGQGTTIKIYLPQTLAKPLVEEISLDEEKEISTGRRVLVVEDEEALRGLLRTILSRLGFQVFVAANGGEALLLMEEQGVKPDLLITDVVMPGMSGAVLVERLRRSQPDLKVLFMSGYTDNAIVHHGVLDPGTPFIQKPFSLKDIAEKIRQVLKSG